MTATIRRRFITWTALTLLAFGYSNAALASVQSQAGKFKIELGTDPATIPVGPAKLLVRVTDAGGKPVDGAQVVVLAQMPGMPMGEREETAEPVGGQPGVYS